MGTSVIRSYGDRRLRLRAHLPVREQLQVTRHAAVGQQHHAPRRREQRPERASTPHDAGLRELPGRLPERGPSRVRGVGVGVGVSLRDGGVAAAEIGAVVERV